MATNTAPVKPTAAVGVAAGVVGPATVAAAPIVAPVSPPVAEAAPGIVARVEAAVASNVKEAEAAIVRRFVTTTEDAPSVSALPPSLRKLNPKTLAEQAAGKRAIAAYAPVAE